MSGQTPFTNIGSDDKFKSRANSIFGCLETLEQKHKQTVTEFQNNDKEQDKTQEGFQKPVGIDCNRNNRNYDNRKRLPKEVPDHVVNPNKWKKYSLKEDGSRELSKGLSADQLNKKIALDFIDDLKQRIIDKDVSSVTSNSLVNNTDTKVTFHKPVTSTIDNEVSTSVSLFGSSHGGKARVMKTYEIGQKVNSKKENIIYNKELNADKVYINLDIDNGMDANTEQVNVGLEVDQENTKYNNNDKNGEVQDDTKGFAKRRTNKRRTLRRRGSKSEDKTD